MFIYQLYDRVSHVYSCFFFVKEAKQRTELGLELELELESESELDDDTMETDVALVADKEIAEVVENDVEIVEENVAVGIGVTKVFPLQRKMVLKMLPRKML